jgi:hypothetical protein
VSQVFFADAVAACVGKCVLPLEQGESVFGTLEGGVAQQEEKVVCKVMVPTFSRRVAFSPRISEPGDVVSKLRDESTCGVQEGVAGSESVFVSDDFSSTSVVSDVPPVCLAGDGNESNSTPRGVEGGRVLGPSFSLSSDVSVERAIELMDEEANNLLSSAPCGVASSREPVVSVKKVAECTEQLCPEGVAVASERAPPASSERGGEENSNMHAPVIPMYDAPLLGHKARLPQDLVRGLFAPSIQEVQDTFLIRSWVLEMGIQGADSVQQVGPTVIYRGLLHNIPVTFLVDSGAQVNLVSKQFCADNPQLHVVRDNVKLHFGNGQDCMTVGALERVPLVCQGHTSRLAKICVSPHDLGSIDLILGTPWLQQERVGVFVDPLPRVQFPSGRQWFSTDGLGSFDNDSADIRFIAGKGAQSFLRQNKGELDVYALRLGGASPKAVAADIRQASENKELAACLEKLSEEFDDVQRSQLPPAEERQGGEYAERKFRNPFVGPFMIEARPSEFTYKLKLTGKLKRVHPVFHAAMLKSVEEAEQDEFPGRDLFSAADRELDFSNGGNIEERGEAVASSEEREDTGDASVDHDGNVLYEIDRVLERKLLNPRAKRVKWRYKVSWKGFGPEDDTWITRDHLVGEEAFTMVRDFDEAEDRKLVSEVS